MRRSLFVTTSPILLATLAVTALACGGGGGGGGGVIPPGRTAAFTPADTSPPDNSISLQTGSVSGDTITVRVAVTGVTDFFGAGFRVVYDPASYDFLSMSSTGSILLTGIPANETTFTAAEAVPGEVLVAATRLQNGTGTQAGVDVVGTATLVNLTFRATADVAANVVTLPAPHEARDQDDLVMPITWLGGTLSAN